MKTYQEPSMGYRHGMLIRNIICALASVCKFALKLAIVLAFFLAPSIIEALIF